VNYLFHRYVFYVNNVIEIIKKIDAESFCQLSNEVDDALSENIV